MTESNPLKLRRLANVVHRGSLIGSDQASDRLWSDALNASADELDTLKADLMTLEYQYEELARHSVSDEKYQNLVDCVAELCTEIFNLDGPENPAAKRAMKQIRSESIDLSADAKATDEHYTAQVKWEREQRQ